MALTAISPLDGRYAAQVQSLAPFSALVGGVTPKGLLHFLSAGTGGPGFRQRLAQDPDIAAKLSPEELERAFDLAHHLRWSHAIIDRALREHA